MTSVCGGRSVNPRSIRDTAADPAIAADRCVNKQSEFPFVGSYQTVGQDGHGTEKIAVPAQPPPSQEQLEHAGKVVDQTNSAENVYPVG